MLTPNLTKSSCKVQGGCAFFTCRTIKKVATKNDYESIASNLYDVPSATADFRFY